MPNRVPDPAETARKWLHLAPGLLALLVGRLGFNGSVALVGLLLAFNLWVFPRLGAERFYRPAEVRRGASTAMVSYPIALLIVALAAPNRLEILAGAWGMLAFGDAAATLAGRRWGRRRLPWNPDKSWFGSVACFVVSWAVVFALVVWTAPGRYSLTAVAMAAGLGAIVATLAEGLPWAMDDNLSVTLLGGGALYMGLSLVGPAQSVAVAGTTRWVALVAVALGVAAITARALDRGGAIAGGAVALAIGLGTGWRGLLLLSLFVVTGTAAGRWRRRVEGGGAEPPRGARNVLANGTAAGACGLLAWSQTVPGAEVAMAAALAAAAADTVGGEIGQGLGGPTWRIVDGHRVRPGTDGGVSWAGLVATGVAAGSVAATGAAVGLFSTSLAVVVGLAGLTGALLDSLLGATLERRGLLDNEAVNLLSTLAAAWMAAVAINGWISV